MSAKIITLTSVRRSAVRCSENGVVFPQLYRLTGYHFKFKESCAPVHGFIENDDDIEPNLDEPTPVAYTLDMEKLYSQIALPRWDPISYLDPAIDDGLVFIRHHASIDSLEGYVDAMVDTMPHYWTQQRWMAFDTEFGLFSLLHREANPGAVNCALVYVTKIRDPMNGLLSMDCTKVIGSEGQRLDEDDLQPPEILEQFAPVKKLLDGQ